MGHIPTTNISFAAFEREPKTGLHLRRKWGMRMLGLLVITAVRLQADYYIDLTQSQLGFETNSKAIPLQMHSVQRAHTAAALSMNTCKR